MTGISELKVRLSRKGLTLIQTACWFHSLCGIGPNTPPRLKTSPIV